MLVELRFVEILGLTSQPECVRVSNIETGLVPRRVGASASVQSDTCVVCVELVNKVTMSGVRNLFLFYQPL